MPEIVSTDFRHYSARTRCERFTGMPRMTLRLRYLTWKLRALCFVLRLCVARPA